ncbi:hypothetical protein PoB_001378900 [Plakobranchus ocellatus]|uniref:Uncharacterized protein n=1 Tax=Plakobranchus ocellatus TaxID=259542 RepID=A0AAV3YW35_9GAST|nr:hypothetical protein PoB_001378900 [Plakobranchus ocellatus]
MKFDFVQRPLHVEPAVALHNLIRHRNVINFYTIREKFCVTSKTTTSGDYLFFKMSTMTTPNQMDIYRTSSKQLLVTRDPLFVHPTVKQGHYVGRQPHTYFPLALFVTIINPVLGPVALVFAYMSNRSYKDGDLIYATKWSNYAFLAAMITVVASVVIYIAIGFAVAGPGVRGGHTP